MILLVLVAGTDGQQGAADLQIRQGHNLHLLYHRLRFAGSWLETKSFRADYGASNSSSSFQLYLLGSSLAKLTFSMTSHLRGPISPSIMCRRSFRIPKQMLAGVRFLSAVSLTR